MNKKIIVANTVEKLRMALNGGFDQETMWEACNQITTIGANQRDELIDFLLQVIKEADLRGEDIGVECGLALCKLSRTSEPPDDSIYVRLYAIAKDQKRSDTVRVSAIAGLGFWRNGQEEKVKLLESIFASAVSTRLKFSAVDLVKYIDSWGKYQCLYSIAIKYLGFESAQAICDFADQGGPSKPEPTLTQHLVDSLMLSVNEIYGTEKKDNMAMPFINRVRRTQEWINNIFG